jgi:GR25 family glycosyltransferase involved in LPS biosynthesis
MRSILRSRHHRLSILRSHKLLSFLLVAHILSILFTVVCWKNVPCYRFLPRLHRELRRNSFNWSKLLTSTKAQTKFSYFEELPIHVISPKRIRERSLQTRLSLEAQRIPYVVAAGVDGLQPLNSSLLDKYAGQKRRQYLKILDPLTATELHMVHDMSSAELTQDIKFALHERLRFACFLSHVLEWESALRKGLPLLVVLEDDAILEKSFVTELRTIINDLPSSWGLLHLNGCYRKLGPAFGHRSRQSQGGLCTYGYVVSTRAMSDLLSSSAAQSNKPIDHMLEEEILTGRLIAFHAEPPLIHVAFDLPSTLGYLS